MSPFQRNGAQLNVEVENSRGSFVRLYMLYFCGTNPSVQRSEGKSEARVEPDRVQRISARLTNNCALRRAFVGSESRISRESRASRLMPGVWVAGRSTSNVR